MKKNRIGIAITFGLIIIGVIVFIAVRAEARRTVSIPILMYHEIGTTENSPWCVPVEIFRAQMAGLRAQGFKTILPSDLAAHQKWGKPLPRKPIIITFDDGYLSNLTIVEPILKEDGFRAIIYLITAQVAETVTERRQYEGKQCLAWPEALAMQKRRTFAFGGHSHEHVNLAGTANPLPQIAECKRQLHIQGIRKPYSFCYPHGQYNKNTEQAVQQAGFQTAVACEDAVASVGPTNDLFALPRVSVMGGTHEFKLLNKQIEPNGKTVVYRFGHAGIPLEISACLYTTNIASLKFSQSSRPLLSFPPRIKVRGKLQRESSARSYESGFPIRSGMTCVVAVPPREVAEDEFELRFSQSKEVEQSVPYTLEIRDKHRLFKLAVID